MHNRKQGHDVIYDPISFLGQQALMIGFVPALMFAIGVRFLLAGKTKPYAVPKESDLGL